MLQFKIKALQNFVIILYIIDNDNKQIKNYTYRINNILYHKLTRVSIS